MALEICRKIEDPQLSSYKEQWTKIKEFAERDETLKKGLSLIQASAEDLRRSAFNEAVREGECREYKSLKPATEEELSEWLAEVKGGK
jgi:hypothetical protein